jgi:tRNA uridine 5-carbamoylmethylation protein Kti12
MGTIHAMCGIQGSGKTTLSKQLAIDHNATLYCYDALPKGHWSNDAHPAMYERIAQDLKDEKTVVCDDLHTTRKMRQTLIEALYGVECKKVLHVMQTPLDVCLERNRQRNCNEGKLPDWALLRCHDKYEAPSLDEGWDEIVYHEYN